MQKKKIIKIVPVHHFYGPMNGAEFIIPNNDIAMDIIKDERIKVMEKKLYEMTCQAWRFKVIVSEEDNGIKIQTKEEFFDPKGENHELLSA